MTNFFTDLERGKVAEEEVATYLTNRGNKLTDVRDNKEFQKKDIDYLVEDRDGRKGSLEIKGDTKFSSTGNIFIEDGCYYPSSGMRKGWSQYCEADYICLYDNNKKIGLIFNWPQLREYAKKDGRNITWDDWKDGSTGYATLVPIKDAISNGFLTFSWNVN